MKVAANSGAAATFTMCTTIADMIYCHTRTQNVNVRLCMQNLHAIDYEDGDNEVLDLKNETWQLSLGSEPQSPEQQPVAATAAAAAVDAGKAASPADAAAVVAAPAVAAEAAAPVGAAKDKVASTAAVADRELAPVQEADLTQVRRF